MIMTDRTKPARRAGAAAVEFAFVAPFVFMVIFGMIEIGRAFMVNHIAGEIARRGCRAAVVAGNTTSFDDITTNYITPQLAAYGLPSKSNGTLVNYYVTKWGSSFNASTDQVTTTSTAITTACNGVSPGSAGTNNYTPGDEIMVQVMIPVSKSSWIPPKFISSTKYFSGQYTLRKE